jgi:DNA-binding MarR family transcriptional regulator
MIITAESIPAHALEAARRQVLEQIDRTGPIPVQELPRGWPLTRHHVRMVVRDLARDGLVVTARDPGAWMPVLTLTPAGRRVVASLPGEKP